MRAPFPSGQEPSRRRCTDVERVRISTPSPSQLAVGDSEEDTKTNEEATTETNMLLLTRTSATKDLLAYAQHMLPKSHTASITTSNSHTCHSRPRPTTICVFPEGTSYTELCIVQVMSGVGWIGGWARELDRVNDSSKSRTYEWGVKMETTDIPTAAVHVKIIQKPVPTTITYADKKRYSSWAPVRVRSFIFVSSYSSSESHLLIFISYFIPFVTLSSECPLRSYPYLRFLTHLHFPPSQSSLRHHHPGRSCFCIFFLVLQILIIIYIYVSSDLILNLNRDG